MSFGGGSTPSAPAPTRILPEPKPLPEGVAGLMKARSDVLERRLRASSRAKSRVSLNLRQSPYTLRDKLGLAPSTLGQSSLA